VIANDYDRQDGLCVVALEFELMDMACEDPVAKHFHV
jgi:hypothetical protein